MLRDFDKSEIKKLYQPAANSSGEDNGQVTIVGGSSLFHGAPILSLKVASRIVDMVFFATPEPSVGRVAEEVKSKLTSFIWVPWEDIDAYIEKSDAILIGPGFMRFGSEKTPQGRRNYNHHAAGKRTREITRELLSKFKSKKWVIDAGSLQVMEAEWIPEGAVLTPNKKEFNLLFKEKLDFGTPKIEEGLKRLASRYHCTIVYKGPITYVASAKDCVEVEGGNPGLTKGGTGDVLAGLTVALLAKNNPFLAASSAAYITKASADELYRKTGLYYNSDDLADITPSVLGKMLS